MNCPYCTKTVYGFTGLQEAKAFEKHLRRCRKNPNNIVMTDGRRTVVTPKCPQTLTDALEIRANDGQ